MKQDLTDIEKLFKGIMEDLREGDIELKTATFDNSKGAEGETIFKLSLIDPLDKGKKNKSYLVSDTIIINIDLLKGNLEEQLNSQKSVFQDYLKEDEYYDHTEPKPTNG